MDIVRLVPWFVLLPALAGTGCSGEEADDDSAPADDDTTAAPDDDVADDDTFADDDASPDWDGSFAGQVVDEEGQPVADLQVTFCLDICFFGNTDAEGRFEFAGLDPGFYKFDAVASPPVDDEVHTNVLIPVDVGEDEAVVLDRPVVLPEIGPPVPFEGEETVALLDGLSLVLDEDGLDLPSWVEEPWVAGARVEEADWPDFVPDGVTFLAAWALAPYDAALCPQYPCDGDDGGPEAPPVGVVLADALGLAPEALVTLWVLSYDDGGWIPVAEGAVSADGSMITSNAGEGLPRLTWVAVSAD